MIDNESNENEKKDAEKNKQDNEKGFWKKDSVAPLTVKSVLVFITIAIILSSMYVNNQRKLEQRDDVRPITVKFENYLRIGKDNKILGCAKVYWSFTTLETVRVAVYYSNHHQLFLDNETLANKYKQKELFSGRYSHFYDEFVTDSFDKCYIFFVNEETVDTDIVLDISVRIRKIYDRTMIWFFDMLDTTKNYFIGVFAAILSLTFAIDKFRSDKAIKIDSNKQEGYTRKKYGVWIK